MPDETIILVPGQMADVRHIAGDEIINRDDAMTFRQAADRSDAIQEIRRLR